MVALRVLPILFPFSQPFAPTSGAGDGLSLQQEHSCPFLPPPHIVPCAGLMLPDGSSPGILVCLAQSHTPHQVGSGPGKVSAPVQVRESTQHSQAESHSCSTLQRVQSAPPTSNSLEEAGDLPKSHICQSSCQNQCLLPSLASCPGPDSTKGHSKSVSYLKNGVITGSSFLGCPRIKGFAQGPYAACSQ